MIFIFLTKMRFRIIDLKSLVVNMTEINEQASHISQENYQYFICQLTSLGVRHN